MTATSPPVPLRRNRDFVLLWTGSAVSVLGSTASAVAYPLLVLALTGSPALAGLVSFAALLPLLLFQLPAGALVDRWDRRRVLVCCDLGRIAGAGAIVAGLVTGHLPFAVLVLIAFVEGTLTVFAELAAGAAIPRVVPAGQLGAAVSATEARERAAGMLGQPLGGVLFGLGRAVPFVLDLVTYVFSLVTVLLVRSRLQDDRPVRTRQRLLPEMVEGLRWLWRQPFLRTAALVIAGSNLLFRALFLVVLVLVAERGGSPATVGLLLGVAGVGGVLGSLAAPLFQRRLSLRAIVVGCNWAWAVLIAMLLVAEDLRLLGALYALMWFVGPIWNVAIATHQLEIVPDRLRGRVLGAAGLLANGAQPLGALAGGLLLAALGTAGSLWVLAGWMVLIAAAATLSRSIRARSGTVPAPEPPVGVPR